MEVTSLCCLRKTLRNQSWLVTPHCQKLEAATEIHLIVSKWLCEGQMIQFGYLSYDLYVNIPDSFTDALTSTTDSITRESPSSLNDDIIDQS